MALLDKAKPNNVWGDIIGEAAFTVQLIPTKKKDKDTSLAGKSKPYFEMIQTHGFVQLNMDPGIIDGLIEFSKKCVVLCR